VPDRPFVPLSRLRDGRRIVLSVVNLIAAYCGAVLREEL
jgi:hypothetical protein